MITQIALKNKIYSLIFCFFSALLIILLSVNTVNAALEIEEDICNYTPPAQPEYSFDLIYAQEPFSVDPGEIFKTTVYLENTGNTTWFSDKSGCDNQDFARLGTARDRDRESVFAEPSLFEDLGWITKSRIELQQEKVAPGELATFIFWSRAPQETDVYREYFQPVIDGVTWVENDDIPIDYFVGDISYSDELIEKLQYMTRTMKASEFDLNAAKMIDINLSTQTLQAKIGNEVIYEFPVSTGKASTPTPTGTYSILYKQDVRATTYIMPNWMAFTSVGHGIHALPSLRYDNGYYWTEALSHIGIPVSHGCVRLLPDDAVTLYNFTPVGTTVYIHW